MPFAGQHLFHKLYRGNFSETKDLGHGDTEIQVFGFLELPCAKYGGNKQ